MASKSNKPSTFLTLLLSLSLLLSTQGVRAKQASCKTRFTKTTTSDYCTKFGTASHTLLQYDISSRIINYKSVTVSNDIESVELELAVFIDQDYEHIMAMDSPTCQQKREIATQLKKIVVSTDGVSSAEMDTIGNQKEGKIMTLARPKMYYFEVLDCDRQVANAFKMGNVPRLLTNVHITTGSGANEFSYEDMGLLELEVLLFLSQGLLFGLMINTFVKYFREEGKWVAPHPVMIYAQAAQITAIFLQMVHLWGYSSDGEGYTVCDVLSKVSQGFSEVAMALLLIMLASGWKLRYQDLDFDDGLEIYLPMTALVLMVQIILVALTFVDMDASHKYHDFAGVQGWCLVVLKTVLFLYFVYSIYDSKEQAKKRKDHQAYLDSLFRLGAAYLLAVPLSVFTSFMYEPYERQYTYTLVSEMAMFSTSAAMFYMLSSPKSSYRQTSTDDAGLPHMR